MSRLRKWTSDDCRAVVLIEALQLDFDCTSLLRPLRRSHAWALCITTKGLRFLLRGCRKAAWPWFWLCINYKSPVQFSNNPSAGTWEPCYLDTQSPWLLHRGLRSEACRKVCTYSFFFLHIGLQLYMHFLYLNNFLDHWLNIRWDRKSRPKTNRKTTCNFFPSPPKSKSYPSIESAYEPIPYCSSWLAMLQETHNQTCPLLE